MKNYSFLALLTCLVGSDIFASFPIGVQQHPALSVPVIKKPVLNEAEINAALKYRSKFDTQIEKFVITNEKLAQFVKEGKLTPEEADLVRKYYTEYFPQSEAYRASQERLRKMRSMSLGDRVEVIAQHEAQLVHNEIQAEIEKLKAAQQRYDVLQSDEQLRFLRKSANDAGYDWPKDSEGNSLLTTDERIEQLQERLEKEPQQMYDTVYEIARKEYPPQRELFGYDEKGRLVHQGRITSPGTFDWTSSRGLDGR